MRRVTFLMKTEISNDSSGRSLLITMAKAVIAASLLGMLLYTLVEYLIQRPEDWADFFVHHLMHTLIVVGVVAVVASATMHKLVIKPVSHVFIHIRRMAAGRIENIDLECRSDEIRSVVESINHLATRLRTPGNNDALAHAIDDIRDLRKQLRETLSDSDASVATMRQLSKLENRLLDVMQEHGDYAPAKIDFTPSCI
jgi:methyl-accepting chemotaxis protein